MFLFFDQTMSSARMVSSPKEASFSVGTTRGLKLPHIHHFIENICGGRERLYGLTSAQVKDRFVVPVTKEQGVSYSEVIDRKDSKQLQGEAVIVVSHALDAYFLDFVDALDHYFDDDASSAAEIVLWIDIFCFNYSTLTAINNEPFDHQRGNQWFALIEHVTNKFGNTLLVLSPWNSRQVFQSPLCLYQIYMTTKNGFLFEIALTSFEKAKFCHAIFRQPEEVKRMFTDPIQVEEAHFADEQVHVPRYTYKYLIQNLLKTSEEETRFYDIIQFAVRLWVTHFVKDLSMKKKSSDSSSAASTPTAAAASAKTPKYDNDGWREEERWHINVLDTELQRITTSIYNKRRRENSIKESADENDDQADDATVNLTSAKKGAAIVVFLDEDYTKIISSLQSLAELYLRKSMYNQAETTLLKLLEIQQQVHGASHQDTLATTFKFAKLCVILKKFAMAEVFFSSYLQNIRICEDVNDRDKLVSIQNVANFYHAQGAYEKAYPVYQECYFYCIQVHGQIHHLTLHTCSMLANISMHIGKHEEAKTLATTCIDLAKQIHGEQHALVLQYKAHYERIIDGSRMSSAIDELELLRHMDLGRKSSNHDNGDHMSLSTYQRSHHTPSSGDTEHQYGVVGGHQYEKSYPLIAASVTEDEYELQQQSSMIREASNANSSSRSSSSRKKYPDESTVCTIS